MKAKLFSGIVIVSLAFCIYLGIIMQVPLRDMVAEPPSPIEVAAIVAMVLFSWTGLCATAYITVRWIVK